MSTKGQGRARESEWKRRDRLSLSPHSFVGSCVSECDGVANWKERGKVEEERANSLLCVGGRERQRAGEHFSPLHMKLNRR